MSKIMMGHVDLSYELGPYYFDFSPTLSEIDSGLYGPFDEKGVPLVDYDKLLKDSPNVNKAEKYGIHYTPVTIAQYGLAIHSKCISTSTYEDMAIAISSGNWLLENLLNIKNDLWVWIHHFDFPIYNLKAPWVSAMAQGQSISLLLRCYQYSGDDNYLEAASRAINSFFYETSDGGVSSVSNRGIWFEEYPNIPNSSVLNGMIFAMLGLYDYYRVTGDKRVSLLIKLSLSSIERNLPEFDWRRWSRYDLIRPERSSELYHQIHIVQLRILFKLTGGKVFDEYANKWESYSFGEGLIIRQSNRFIYGIFKRLGLLNYPYKEMIGITLKSASSNHSQNPIK